MSDIELYTKQHREIRERYLEQSGLKRFGYVEADYTDSYSLWLEGELIRANTSRASDDGRDEIFRLICAEIDRAYSKHGTLQWGRHEFYAITKEEFDEVWDDIKSDAPQEQLVKEIIQVAAMCIRYLETKDRYREPLPSSPAGGGK